MIKDVTKKCLAKENVFSKKMISLDVYMFMERKGISYDEIECSSMFNTKHLDSNTNNLLESGDKFKIVVNKKKYKTTQFEFNMIYCSTGEFTMGVDAEDYTYPASSRYTNHVVIDKPFLISEKKITRAFWDFVMEDNGYITSLTKLNKEHPITDITWFDALLFCNTLSKLDNKKPCYIFDWDVSKRKQYIHNCYMDSEKNIVALDQISDIFFDKNANGYRLPTEIEWEYAALADCNYLYAGSDNLDEVACYGLDKITKVATKKPNAWGLYDMSGLTYEFCNDVFVENIYENRKFDTKVKNEIIGFDTKSEDGFEYLRVLRGFGFESDSTALEKGRIKIRSCDYAEAKINNYSFRIVRQNI